MDEMACFLGNLITNDKKKSTKVLLRILVELLNFITILVLILLINTTVYTYGASST